VTEKIKGDMSFLVMLKE